MTRVLFLCALVLAVPLSARGEMTVGEVIADVPPAPIKAGEKSLVDGVVMSTERARMLLQHVEEVEAANKVLKDALAAEQAQPKGYALPVVVLCVAGAVVGSIVGAYLKAKK